MGSVPTICREITLAYNCPPTSTDFPAMIFFPQSTGAAALLNFGMQRRSYFNFKAGLGASYHHQGAALDKSWQPAFQAELASGLAFGEGQLLSYKNWLTLLMSVKPC